LTRSGVTLNEVGDVIVRDAETMLALTDIERYRLVERLRQRGQSSSADLAVDVGRSQTDIEAALDRLASVGLVVMTSTASDDEKPLWEAVGRGLFLDAPDDPEILTAAKALANVMMADLFGLPRRWADEVQPGLSSSWWRASGVLNVGTTLSTAELNDIQAKMEALLEPYVNRPPSQYPQDSRRVRLLSFFMPEAS
jgi:hypothetical protein